MRTAHAALLPLLLLSPLALAGSAPAQGFDSVEIEVVRVAEGVHMLKGRGGNMGLAAGPEGAFLVDDQYAPLTGKIRAAVGEVTDVPIRYVLNTHWHPDHTGGNEELGEAGAILVAHDAVRRRLSTEQWNALAEEAVPPSPPEALPVVTFSEDVTFHPEGHEIHVFHVPPAHTDGDSVVHFREANVVHAGDVFFNGQYPYIDVPSGGRIEGMIDAAGRILELANAETKIIPGHGPLGDREDLARYRKMLVAVRDRVKALVEEGKGEQAAVDARPTRELDERWAQGFLSGEQFTRIVFRSLTADG